MEHMADSKPKPLIRRAVLSDYSEIANMMKDFHEESPFKVPFCYSSWYDFFVRVIEQPHENLLFNVEVTPEAISGLLLASAYPHPWVDVTLASEMVWYVRPGFRTGRTGLRLFRTFEDWVRAHKYAFAQSGSLVTANRFNAINNFYARKGYVPREIIYYKDFRECASLQSPSED